VNVQILIDSIVRQVTVLLAQLATVDGVRAPLGRVANQVFLDLTDELYEQGVSRKVSADMFGMALRTYLRKIQRVRESSTDRGQSLWQAVLGFLSHGRLVSRAEVLGRFHRDDADLVRGVLHDLTEGGLVLRIGSGPNTAYRAATQDELASLRSSDDNDGLDEVIWALVFREGPLTREELSALVRGVDLEGALTRLVSSGRVQRGIRGEMATYFAREFFVPLEAGTGWEAAVLDHFQAVVRTIGARLGKESSAKDGLVGGSTYSFDVWPGHPHEGEVLALLGTLRERAGALRQTVRAYNAVHARPARYTEATFYGGQWLLEREDAEELEYETVQKT
jgi:hypothetical protein